MYKIGLFSKINKVTIKTLRHYDEIGLLKPKYIDEFTGYRYYTTEQQEELHKIISLRQIGLSLNEIIQIKKGTSLESILIRKKSELLKEIADTTMKLSQVEYYLSIKEEVEDMNYNIILKEITQVVVASMKTTIPNYDALFDVVPSMGEEMARLGCECAIPEYCFNIYLDGEYKEENINIEICEAVVEAKEDSDIVKFKTIPKVKEAACVLHRGPYESLPKAYNAIMKWMDENGFEPDDNPRESYIDGIWNKESSEEWLTEIQFPIRKKINI